MTTELNEARLTAAHAYDYWATLAHVGVDFDYEPVDLKEAQAAMIGWASRDQNELI